MIAGGLAIVGGHQEVRAQGLEGRALLGRWSGEVQGPANLKYVLTLTSADGNKLFGRARTEMADKVSEYDVAGALEGNVFSYKSANHDLEVQLTVAGDTMSGTGVRTQTGVTGRFELKRVR
jgi:hypothetical protein